MISISSGNLYSPIKWVGSKRRLRKQIVELFPEHTCYVEPFLGGGSVFFWKEPSKVEVLNDYDNHVVNFFKILRDNEEELMGRIENTLISRKLFMEYRQSNWKELDSVERAYRFYYIIKCSFGGLWRFNQQGECNSPFAGSPSPKAKPTPYTKNSLNSLKKAHKRLQGAIIESDDYVSIVKRYDRVDTLFFFDPPYDTEYSYGVSFDYDELLEVCRSMRGKFILTLNYGMIEMFSEFNITKTEVNYSITCKGGDNKNKEIIITNFK